MPLPPMARLAAAGEVDAKEKAKAQTMDKHGRDKPRHHWLPAREETFAQPLRQSALEGRREFEGRRKLVRAEPCL